MSDERTQMKPPHTHTPCRVDRIPSTGLTGLTGMSSCRWMIASGEGEEIRPGFQSHLSGRGANPQMQQA